MDRADSCRRAARDAVADVDPPHLQEVIDATLDGASMTPGVLTLESAATLDPDADLDAITHHAAGVQLIYEGLRLTRTLAHEEPWTDETVNGEGDLLILAADILVARGFYLLARTEAAGKAVRTVQAFGRDQTRRQVATTEAATRVLDANLERDVLELAVLAGAVAVGSTPTTELLDLAADVADDADGGFPPADDGPTAEDHRETRPGDGMATDHATSATDP